MTAVLPQSFDDGRYQTTALLKEGEHGRVYVATDGWHHENVVLKLFRNDADTPAVAAAMFDREVAALETLTHPHIVRKKRSFRADEGQCIVLEYVPGEQSLAARIEQGRPPTLAWRVSALRSLLGAIQHAHAQGVLHRDITLANVLVDVEEGQVKLADFGIAKLQRALETADYRTLREFYTLPFAAPEQVRGHEPDTKSDVYAFGVTMAAVLAWRNPPKTFERADLEDFLAPLAQEVPAGTFGRLLSVLRDTLDRQGSVRPDTFELAEELRRLAVEIVAPRALVVRLSQKSQQALQADDRTKAQVRDDLNSYLKGKYEPSVDRETGDPSYLIRLYGRSVQLLLRPETRPGSPEGALYVSNIEWPEQDVLQGRRAGADKLPFTVAVADFNLPPSPAQDLVEFLLEKHEQREQAKTARAARDAFVALPRTILELEKSRTRKLVLRYQAEVPSRRAGKTFFGVQRDRPFQLRVLGAARRHLDEGSAAVTPGDQPFAPHLLERHLQADLGGRANVYTPEPSRLVGRVDGFTPGRHLLGVTAYNTLKLPVDGEVVLLDPAATASLNRQEAALNAFVQGDYVNPELARRLMLPHSNDLNEVRPRQPLQKQLQASPQVPRLLGRALAAEDFFLVQGPPGTGKTTLIVDLVGQILREQPHARVLVTSQSNQAVDHVLLSLGGLGESWRSVRYASESWEERGKLPPFQQSFQTWLSGTRERCHAAISRYVPQGEERGDEVRAALEAWAIHLDATDELAADFVDGVSVFGATCVTVRKMQRELGLPAFDWVIVDEAARATTAEVLIPLLAARRCVMVGDHKQLPPFLDDVVEQELGTRGLSVADARRSLFEDLFQALREDNRHSLRTQYRMHPSIGRMVGDVFYSELHGLDSAVTPGERPLHATAFQGEHRVFWVDVRGAAKLEPGATSSYNDEEIAAVHGLLRQLSSSMAPGQTHRVSVISPYAAQKERLARMVERERATFPNLDAGQIRVGTVDAFQGEEDDVVICSLVKIGERAQFVSDPRRLNVTFSRARSLLVIVGNHARARTHPVLREVTHPSYLPEANVWTPEHLLDREAAR